jgi:hypothetical protein
MHGGGTRSFVRTCRKEEGDYVMVHGPYSGGGRPTRIVVDILRIEASATAPRARFSFHTEEM